MDYKNIDILTAVVTEWIRPLISTIASSYLDKTESVTRANAWAKKFFPVSANYSITNDFGFLIAPIVQSAVRPFLKSNLERFNISDENIPEFAMNVVSSAYNELGTKKSISLFNMIEIDKGDLDRLKSLLDKNMPVSASHYNVVK